MNKVQATVMTVAALAIIKPFLTYAQVAEPVVVDKKRIYRQQVTSDKEHLMVLLDGYIPHALFQLHYATKENFTHQQLYPNGNRTFLRKPVAAALQRAALYLEQLGYGLVIWDAYRPYGVSKKMWQLVPDERYVANPSKGSGHNRGIAVDLSLYVLQTGSALDMGTGFDHFSDTAHHDFTGLNPQQQYNRSLLKKAMELHGFKALPTEWWHYSWQGKHFPLLDLSFRQLARLAN